MSEIKELAGAGVLFQGVQCHPVFAEIQHVSTKRLDEFVDLLRVSSAEALALYRQDISALYTRLLDCGFFDSYLHVHFDVLATTTYATVVTNAKYAFDTRLARIDDVWFRADAAKQYTERLSRVEFLRQRSMSADVLARENARYFSFSSFLDEMSQHARATRDMLGNGGATRKNVSFFGGATYSGATSIVSCFARSGMLKILLIAILVSPTQTIQHNLLCCA